MLEQALRTDLNNSEIRYKKVVYSPGMWCVHTIRTWPCMSTPLCAMYGVLCVWTSKITQKCTERERERERERDSALINGAAG